MLKKLSITIFILTVNISFIYAKNVVVNLACMPPEGTMDKAIQDSYVSSIEGAFLKVGHHVSDRQRLEKLMKEILLQQTSGIVDEASAAAEAGKIMKVDYFVAVILNDWTERRLNVWAMEQDKKNDRLQPRENYYIYSDKMRITIKLIEVETSRIIAQEDFQGNKLDRPSKLATKIVKNMDKQIQKHFKMKK